MSAEHDVVVQQILRFREEGLTVQVIASRCSKTKVFVQQVLEARLGEKPGKGRKK